MEKVFCYGSMYPFSIHCHGHVKTISLSISKLAQYDFNAIKVNDKVSKVKPQLLGSLLQKVSELIL